MPSHLGKAIGTSAPGAEGRRQRKRASKTFWEKSKRGFATRLVALTFLVVSWILSSNKKAKTFKTPTLDKTILYSWARSDRSGSAIHDMLMAHAYSYREGRRVYGGACPTDHTPPRNATVDLIRELGLDATLRIGACPNEVHPNATMIVENLYRDQDSSLFTESWRQQILAELAQNPRYALGKRERRNDTATTFHVAVHLRRGDVGPCRYPTRYLPNNHYLQLIEMYTPPRDRNDDVQVTIYSQRNKHTEPFTVFEEKGYHLSVDTTDLATTWKAMSSADVLIMSKSSFSYVPALLNPRGTVVYTPFAHQPAAWWDIVNDAQLLERTKLEVDRMRQEANCTTTRRLR